MRPLSTRRESLAMTDVPLRKTQVLEMIRQHGPASRAEIAKRTGLKLSCVCARVNELLKEGMLYSAGTVFDLETSRNVEVICESK